MQPTQDSSGAGHPSSSTWPCSGWGLPCDLCYQKPGALLPHLFTLTCAAKQPSAVYSLWHFPSPLDARALPGTLPCGARTFLRRQATGDPHSRTHHNSTTHGIGESSAIAFCASPEALLQPLVCVGCPRDALECTCRLQLNKPRTDHFHVMTTHARLFDQLYLANVATHALFEVDCGPSDSAGRALLLANFTVVALLDTTDTLERDHGSDR